MKRMTSVVVLVGLGITTASLSLWSDNDRSCDGNHLPPSACDIAGSWVINQPAIPGIYANPLVAGMVVTPIDQSGQRFAGVIMTATAEPTLLGLFPDANRFVDSVTTIVRSGPRTYKFSQLGYAAKSCVPDRGQILYFLVFSGTATFVNANTVKRTGMFSMYSNVDRPELIVPPWGINGVHDQDKDDDGLADAGEVPFLCMPFEDTMKRFPLTEPCAP